MRMVDTGGKKKSRLNVHFVSDHEVNAFPEGEQRKCEEAAKSTQSMTASGVRIQNLVGNDYKSLPTKK